MNFVCGNPVVDLEPMAENRAEQLEYNEDLVSVVYDYGIY